MSIAVLVYQSFDRQSIEFMGPLGGFLAIRRKDFWSNKWEEGNCELYIIFYQPCLILAISLEIP